MSRYSKHILLEEIGEKGQLKLIQAKVLVIGAGGLGCPVLQYLVAAGIGTIGVIDFDVVEKSNLQRQVLYGTTSLGKNKALASKETLENLNDEISILAYPKKLTHQNAIALFEKYDVIVDGTDNFYTRYLVNDASVITNKPVVYGAIYKFEGQVTVFNYQGSASYRCLFPENLKNTAPNCSKIGVLGVLPGIIGTLQANEVLKIILNIGEILNGKLLYYNALNSSTRIIKYNRNETEINSVLTKKADFQQHSIVDTCQTDIQKITAKQAFEIKNSLFVDVRELNELPKIELENSIQLPLSTIKDSIHQIDNTKNVVFFCKSAVRSKQAIIVLNMASKTNVYHVENGVNSLLKYIKNGY